MTQQFKQTIDFLKPYCKETPKIGLVLGTGLGGMVEKIDVTAAIPYAQIPNFPISTVEGHKGELVFGYLSGKFVVAMNGRFHYYEGYSMQQVTFPIRIFKLLGVEKLILSNAAGGTNPAFEIGDIMLVDDHINFMPEHPLRGKNLDEFGPRFVDMSKPYSARMIGLVKDIAAKNNIRVHTGTYLGLQGPTFETPGEYKMITAMRSDAVGMSTVPEVIVARHCSIECFAVSVITDLGVEGKVVEVSHEEVQEIGRQTTPKVIFLVENLVKQL